MRSADDFGVIRARVEELRVTAGRGYATGGVVPGPGGTPLPPSPVPLHTTGDGRCSACGGSLVESWVAQECTGTCMG